MVALPFKLICFKGNLEGNVLLRRSVHRHTTTSWRRRGMRVADTFVLKIWRSWIKRGIYITLFFVKYPTNCGNWLPSISTTSLRSMNQSSYLFSSLLQSVCFLIFKKSMRRTVLPLRILRLFLRYSETVFEWYPPQAAEMTRRWLCVSFYRNSRRIVLHLSTLIFWYTFVVLHHFDGNFKVDEGAKPRACCPRNLWSERRTYYNCISGKPSASD